MYKITLTDTEVFSTDMNLDIKGSTAMQNSKDACIAIGGVEEIAIHQEKYGNLEFNQQLMQEIEHIITEKKIDTVFFHYISDYNSDHLAAHKISKVASRHCDNLFMFQSNPYITDQGFAPNCFIDISGFIDKKEKALKCYEKDHDRQGRLFESNIERNRLWGYGNGVKEAEGFVCIKCLIS